MIHNICQTKLLILFYLRKILLISSICLTYKLFFYNKKKTVTINDEKIIQDPKGNQYIVESRIGKGTFGKVVQCRVKNAMYA